MIEERALTPIEHFRKQAEELLNDIRETALKRLGNDEVGQYDENLYTADELNGRIRVLQLIGIVDKAYNELCDIEEKY